MNPALVMFDLDGTLVETAPEIADAVNDTLAEAGWPVVTQGQVEGWIGQGTGELLIAALSQATGMAAHAVGDYCQRDANGAPVWPWSPTRRPAMSSPFWLHMGFMTASTVSFVAIPCPPRSPIPQVS